VLSALALTPAAIISEAKVWRHSWSPIGVSEPVQGEAGERVGTALAIFRDRGATVSRDI
jgi:hypothetical protein